MENSTITKKKQLYKHKIIYFDRTQENRELYTRTIVADNIHVALDQFHRSVMKYDNIKSDDYFVSNISITNYYGD